MIDEFTREALAIEVDRCIDAGGGWCLGLPGSHAYFHHG